MTMLRPLLAVFVLATGPALAEHPAECRVAENHIETSFHLPQVAKAIADKRLDVLVVGAGSSTLGGAGNASKSYPTRLQVALTDQLPGVAVKVTSEIKPGRNAPEALKALISGLATTKPALVIWQAGTVDALKSLEIDSFIGALDRGVDAAKNANADVVLMNAQYSPRTESIIALGTYLDNMRWVALQREVPLFDRFGIMQLWAELGTFDFNTATKKLDMAIQVHDCIGRLLADLVIAAAKSVDQPAGVAR